MSHLLNWGWRDQLINLTQNICISHVIAELSLLPDAARVPFTEFVLVKTQTLVPLVEINFVGLPVDCYVADAAAGTIIC